MAYRQSPQLEPGIDVAGATGAAARRTELAAFLRQFRSPLAGLIHDEITRHGATFFWSREEDQSTEEWVSAAVGSVVDLLRLHLETLDEAYLSMFSSDLRRCFRPAERADEASIGRRRAAGAGIIAAFTSFAATRLGSEARADLSALLDALASRVNAEASERVEVLLIGDCYMFEIFDHFEEALIGDGYSIDPIFVGSRNPSELRNAIRQHAARRFDLVFYSPFTYDHAVELTDLYGVGAGLIGRQKMVAMCESAIRGVKPTVDLVCQAFECPVFIHNAGVVQRFEATIKSRLKAASSRSIRRQASAELKGRTALLIAEVTRELGREQLHLIDEAAVVASHGDERLGTLSRTTHIHHRAPLGGLVADQYRDCIVALKRLSTKKLVITDLDNTLWDGVIGEGPVTHLPGRQATLKTLRRRGVLLAVNSKNDPRNVSYEGCGLGAEDFVTQEINWDPKPSNVRRIQQTLNLKAKDFVFIDDRPDEREMVQQAFPEISVLDATSDRAWRLLDRWAELLPSDPGLDRTRSYKERAAREVFVESLQKTVEDPAEFLGQLRIQVTISRAGKGDLPRVAELINRTNQFNVNGARTTLKEVERWHASGSFHVLQASVADKFGDSGVVGICVAEVAAEEVRIPAFVLSCRVFGYGVERVLINHVKQQLRGPSQRIFGSFKQTTSNQPCHQFYPDNGFEPTAGGYAWNGEGGKPDPSWLTVVRR